MRSTSRYGKGRCDGAAGWSDSLDHLNVWHFARAVFVIVASQCSTGAEAEAVLLYCACKRRCDFKQAVQLTTAIEASFVVVHKLMSTQDVAVAVDDVQKRGCMAACVYYWFCSGSH